MSLPELCIRRPVMTTLITLSFIIFRPVRLSAIAGRGAPPRRLPDDLGVRAASRRLAGDDGGLGRRLRSSANSQHLGDHGANLDVDPGVHVDHDPVRLDRNIDGAALDVQAAISASLRRLPSDLPNPPSFRKVNPADQPVLFLAASSSTLPLSTVNDYGETILQQQISQINGVAQVLIYGAQKYAVRILVDPDAVAARGLNLNDVRAAVATANSNQPSAPCSARTSA